MANIFKLHECQTFGLMKMHNISKIWFGDNKFNLGLSVARNCLRHETALLAVLAIKRELLCTFATTFRCYQSMGHSGTDLKFSFTIEF